MDRVPFVDQSALLLKKHFSIGKEGAHNYWFTIPALG
jgi:hypothetical protein